MTEMRSCLRLDAVQAPAPKHVAPLQLHFSVVNLVAVLHLLQLLLGDLLLLCAMPRRLQELQPASRDAGDQLRGRSGNIFNHRHANLKILFFFNKLVGTPSLT